MKPIDNSQAMIKYVQVLYNDMLAYCSRDDAIATEERRAILLNNINLIKSTLNSLEASLSQDNNG